MSYEPPTSALGDCIDAVYQAARRLEDWPSVLALFAETFPGTKWAVASELPRARRNIGIIWQGFEDGLIRDYVDHYASINPWVPHAARNPVLKAAASDDFFPSRLFKNHEFYAGFIEQAREAESATAIKLFQDADSFAVLSVHYGSRMAATYNQELPRFLDALAPHFKNAVEINAELLGYRSVPQTLAAMIGEFADATFLIDGDGRIHVANQAAETLLAERTYATRDGKGRLNIASPVMARRLKALLSANNPRAIAEAGTMAVPGSDRWRFIDVSLGESAVSHAWLPGRGRWIIALFSPPQASDTADGVLAARFGLTAKQKAIALALVDGDSLSETADRMGISINTARQHLKAIFAKTGTNRQAELVSRLHVLTYSRTAGGGPPRHTGNR